VHNEPHTGEAVTKAEAVSEAKRAIDRALSLGKLRVVRQKSNANRGWRDATCEPPSVNSHLKRAGNLQSLASEARWTARSTVILGAHDQHRKRRAVLLVLGDEAAARDARIGIAHRCVQSSTNKTADKSSWAGWRFKVGSSIYFWSQTNGALRTAAIIFASRCRPPHEPLGTSPALLACSVQF
jgi:hypothetical protein